jgi:OOP family OmpA-OmpF porin
MRFKAAVLALALAGVSGCSNVSQFVSRQYYPAQPQFVVEYGPSSSTIDQTGLATIAGAARLALGEPDSTVQVVGFASTVGADDPSQTLPKDRAEAVATQLIADGVDASRVTSMARGATAYQFSPAAAQRVEINVVKAGF